MFFGHLLVLASCVSYVVAIWVKRDFGELASDLHGARGLMGSQSDWAQRQRDVFYEAAETASESGG